MPRTDFTPAAPRDASHWVHLDAMRGLAALVVVGFHARLLFFVDRLDAAPVLRSGLTEAFYMLTAFGREAVLAFFVLSGFLIAGSVHRDHLAGRWSASGYAIARLSRLYVVLVPALVLGIAWDVAGLSWFGNAAAYGGTLANGMFPVDVAARLGSANILGCLAFLQAIFVAPPGSNEQFWSLSYEFWCYALFGLLYTALWSGSRPRMRAAAVVAGAAIAWGLGAIVFSYFGCWLLGAALAVMPAPPRGRFLAALGIGVVAGVLFLIKQYGLRHPQANFLLAIGFVLLIAGCRSAAWRAGALWRCYRRAASWLAQRSFSLYAVHVPPLVFVRAGLGDALWQPTLANMALWLALVAGCLVYAELVWQLAERHTPLVRAWLNGKFGLDQARASS